MRYHRFRPLSALLAVSLVALVSAAAVGASSTRSTVAAPDLAPVKQYLLGQTALLTGFTKDFEALAAEYDELAAASGYRYPTLWAAKRQRVASLLLSAKRLWVKGNPYYERMEGIVAGTPSLAKYDVIIDAGSSAAADPSSAVPFDLKLPDGRVFRKPGNLYNLTEGMLWGTRPEFVVKGVRADLDGDGALEFGEVVPDARALHAATVLFRSYAGELARAAKAWQPTGSDAFTAAVVMVPTMSEYFGQWKVSRFVLGAKATGDSFNVVSRLSDINDIIASIEVIYRGIKPAIASIDAAQGTQTGKEIAGLRAFVERIATQEKQGKRFTPAQADALGREAQERATAVAGQLSQAAARLKIAIVQ